MKTVKKLLISLVAVFALLGLSGCQNKKSDLEYILDKGTFILGYTDFPPMGYRQDGVATGFDIELAQAVIERLGVTFVTRYIDWQSKEFELKSRRIDAIWNGLTITDERKLEITFSEPYFNNRLVMVTRAASTIETVSELSGVKVGVETTSSADLAVSGNTTLLNSLNELKKYNDSATAILALRAGQVDVVVVDEIYARYVVMVNNPTEFRIADETLGDELYGIGYRLNDFALRDRIDEIIEELRQEGLLTTLSIKYFGEDLFE